MPQRFDRAAELIRAAGFTVLRHSKSERFKSDFDVYLIDSIGHLASFYGVASVAFVGGTLAPIGGHNVLEPYTYKVPVIAGPRLEKTRDFARLLEERDALFVVKNASEMAHELQRLFGDSNLRREIGERGNKLLLDSQGAVGKAISIIEKTLSLESDGIRGGEASQSDTRENSESKDERGVTA